MRFLNGKVNYVMIKAIQSYLLIWFNLTAFPIFKGWWFNDSLRFSLLDFILVSSPSRHRKIYFILGQFSNSKEKRFSCVIKCNMLALCQSSLGPRKMYPCKTWLHQTPLEMFERILVIDIWAIKSEYTFTWKGRMVLKNYCKMNKLYFTKHVCS